VRFAETLHLDEDEKAEFGQELDARWLEFYRMEQERSKAGPALEDAAELLQQMPEDVQVEAQRFLEAPNLIPRILHDFDAIGVVGEQDLARPSTLSAFPGC